MALEGFNKSLSRFAGKTEDRYQSIMSPVRGYADPIGKIALMTAVGGLGLSWYTYEERTLPQLRANTPVGEDVRATSQDKLNSLLDEGKTEYGDMPGTTLSGLPIEGAEDMILAAHMVTAGLITMALCAGAAEGRERAVLGAGIAANFGTEMFMGKSLYSVILGFMS